MKEIKVCHIITGLGEGGAEKSLFKLVSNMDAGFKNIVVSLSGPGVYKEILINNGVKVYCLNLTSTNFLFKFYKLYLIIKKENPKFIQTWMYHADMIGLLLKFLMPGRKLFWNIRHSKLIKGVDKNSILTIAKICGSLSHIPDKIVCGSKAAAKTHQAMGYKKEKMYVIQNGFNISAPKTNQNALKESFSIPENYFIIGHVGRFHPVKNQEILIRAFAKFQRKNANCCLVLIGKGLDENNNQLKLLVEKLAIKNVFFVGQQPNAVEIMGIFDIFILPSKSEGFSNVLGEAMSMSIPCIATDVGDNREIIGETGIVVSLNNLEENLTSAMQNLYDLSLKNRAELGKRASERVTENYSLDKIVSKYQNLYLREGNIK